MFNFLNSAVLVAAVAALIPLLIHLFSRRRVKIVPFSSLKHLKEMQKRQVRRLKIRQLLLLLLRMLIILLAVLAFARPASKGGYIGSHAGVSSVILLDRSGSMQRQVKDGILFDLAKKRTSEILKSFGQSDELLLVPYDRQPYFPAGEQFFSSDVASGVLKDVTPGYDISNLGDAYKKGIELLAKAKNLNRELYLVTDRAETSLPQAPDAAAPGISTYFAELPLETDGNCGIVNVDLGGQLIEVGNDFTVKAEIQNYDDRAKDSQLASLFVDGNRVMQAEFRLEPGGKQTVEFKNSVAAAGLHYGWVEINDDGFLPDNRFYFSFNIPQQFNVLIVDGDGAGQLVQLALVPSEDLARYWSVKTVTPQQLTSVAFSEFDAVVLSGVSSLDPVVTSQLLRYIDGGGGLMYVIGSNIDPGYFNASFGDKVDFQIQKPAPTDFSGAGYYTLERFDYTHPIFKAFGPSEKDSLPTFKFFALPAVKSGPAHRDLAYFSNSVPAIVEARYGTGKMIVLSGSLSPVYTDLSSHSFFVPFIIRTMEYLAGQMGAYELRNYVGQNVTRSLPEKTASSSTVQLITPDNRSFLTNGTEKTGQIAFECSPVDVPGVYQLKVEDRVVDLFPVNVPPQEGRLAAADYERLKSTLGISKYKVIPYDQAPDKIITEARFGRELWKIFLWGAAILLAVEMLFAREKELKAEE